MALPENLDQDLKSFAKEDGNIDAVTATDLGNFLHQSQDDALAAGETSEQVKKFFDYIGLHVFLPWLQALTNKANAEGVKMTGAKLVTDNMAVAACGFADLPVQMGEVVADRAKKVFLFHYDTDKETENVYYVSINEVQASIDDGTELNCISSSTTTIVADIDHKLDFSQAFKVSSRIHCIDSIDNLKLGDSITIQRKNECESEMTGDSSLKNVFLIAKEGIYYVSAADVMRAVAEKIQLKPIWKLPTDEYNADGEDPLTGKALAAALKLYATNIELKEIYKKIEESGGVPGKDGHTPIKGVDYFTPKDIQEIVDMGLSELPARKGAGNGSIEFGDDACEATGDNSLAGGTGCKAKQKEDVALGFNCIADGKHAAAINSSNESLAPDSFSHGCGNKALGHAQRVGGKFCAPDSTKAEIVGNGKSDSERSNAYALDWEGNAWFAGTISDKDGDLRQTIKAKKLSKSGDTFGATDVAYRTPDSASKVAIHNGNSAKEGAGIWLYGNNNGGAGKARIQVYDVASDTYRQLDILPNGDLKWNGELVHTYIEDTKCPGCYYRIVNGVKEWINPPMVSGVEYRTTKRFAGKPVYVSQANFGALPASGSTTVKFGQEGDVFDNVVSLNVMAIDSDNKFYPFPFVTSQGELRAMMRMGGVRTVYIGTFSDISHYTGRIMIEYTKA